MTIINKIIDGKMYAEKLLGEIHTLSKGFLNNFNRKPCLTVILVGDNPASKIYVKNKILLVVQPTSKIQRTKLLILYTCL